MLKIIKSLGECKLKCNEVLTLHLLQSFKLKSQDILALGEALTQVLLRAHDVVQPPGKTVRQFLARLDVYLPHEPATHSQVAPKIKDVHSKAYKVSLAVEPQTEVTSRSIHMRMSNSKG